jgi:hypothetical protein
MPVKKRSCGETAGRLAVFFVAPILRNQGNIPYVTGHCGSSHSAAKRFGEHPTARVKAVLNALEDRKPIAKAISPMLRVPRRSSSLAKAILQCNRYSIGPAPTILRNLPARVDRETPQSRAKSETVQSRATSPCIAASARAVIGSARPASRPPCSWFTPSDSPRRISYRISSIRRDDELAASSRLQRFCLIHLQKGAYTPRGRVVGRHVNQ